MASTVLSGTGNVTYTNSTGQNVRVVINFMQGPSAGSPGTFSVFNMSFGGATISVSLVAIGRNLSSGSIINTSSGAPLAAFGQNALYSQNTGPSAAPTEIMLAPGQTFSTSAPNPSYPLGAYNIVVIPEAG